MACKRYMASNLPVKLMEKDIFDKDALKACCYKQHAILFGYKEAVILSHFMFWTKFNRNKKQHFHDGRYWSYSSIHTLQKSYFPFWSEGQISRGISSLFQKNLILKGNYNRFKYDKTTWYALSDEDGLLEMTRPFYTDDKWSELE